MNTSETEAKASAAQQVLNRPVRPCTGQKPPEPGLSLEFKCEQEKWRKNILINEHNRLTFTAKQHETKLKELQDFLKQPLNCSSEDQIQQRIRQLENNLDKMRVKIAEAKNIQSAYRHVSEHLQQEVHALSKALDQKERSVSIGQAELDKASRQYQSAAAAAESTLDRMVQLENETTEKKLEMDAELSELRAEEKELKKKMETVGLTGQNRMGEQETEEEGHSEPVTDQSHTGICAASQSDLTLVEDMEALREALGCAEVQDVVTKVVSQRATKEQLLLEATQDEELTRQDVQTLADLELLYAQLKFSVKPTSLDKLKGNLQTELKEGQAGVRRLEAELQQTEDLLDAAELGVNNLYFRMSCVPVEELPSVSRTDRRDKLRDIRARLPTLLQRASEQRPAVGLDLERVYRLIQQLNSTEVRNVKRPATPTDAPQLSDDEEEFSPSREEMKRCSMRLIECGQNKKSSRRGRRKP